MQQVINEVLMKDLEMFLHTNKITKEQNPFHDEAINITLAEGDLCLPLEDQYPNKFETDVVVLERLDAIECGNALSTKLIEWRKLS